MKQPSPLPDAIVAALTGFLSERKEEAALPEVAERLERTVKKARKADKIMLASASPIPKEEEDRIKAIVGSVLSAKLPVEKSIDTKLIAGFTVRAGDFFLDASIASELDNLARALLS